MKKIILLTTVLFTLTSIVKVPSFAEPLTDNDLLNEVMKVEANGAVHSRTANRILVKFKDRAKISNQVNGEQLTIPKILLEIGATRNNGLEFKKNDENVHIEFLELENASNLMNAINTLTASGLVEYAVPDYEHHQSWFNSGIDKKPKNEKLLSSKMQTTVNSEIPNDPLFSDQWSLNNTGQDNGKVDADIDFPEALEVAEKNSESVVALLGFGVSVSHEDLVDNIWTNSDEIPDNQIDDDNNGVIDDIHGVTCWNGSIDGTVGQATEINERNLSREETNFTGTWAAGIIAATNNNNIGISGIDPNAKILPLRYKQLVFRNTNSQFDDVEEFWRDSDMLACINHSIRLKQDFGVNLRVIHIDSTTSTSFGAFRDAIQAAGQAGILVVRNYTGPDNGGKYVLQTLPTDRNDEVVGRFGTNILDPYDIDLGAPGKEIDSTIGIYSIECISFEGCFQTFEESYVSNFSFLTDGGLSSSAHAAGAASLLFSHDPTLTPEGVKNLLRVYGDTIPALSELTNSGKRLNVDNAIRCLPGETNLEFINLREDFKFFKSTTQSIEVIVYDCGHPITVTGLTGQPDNGDEPINFVDDGTAGDTTANDGVYTGLWNVNNIADSVNLSISDPNLVVQNTSITGTIRDSLGVEEISLNELVNITGEPCSAGAVYRFSTNSEFSNTPLDVLVTVGENEGFRDFQFDECLNVQNEILSITLGDMGDQLSFAELNYQVVEAGTNIPLAANALLMTVLDLDAQPGITGSDDIFINAPTALFVSPNSEVTGHQGSYFDEKYSHLLEGTLTRNCQDRAIDQQPTCRGAAYWDSKGVGISEVDFRVQNTSTPFDPSFEQTRLFLISFRLEAAQSLDNRPPRAIISNSALSGPAPLTVSFSGEQSFDPDGNEISYSWEVSPLNVNGSGEGLDTIFEETFLENGTYTVTLTVTDDLGSSAKEVIFVTVTENNEDIVPPSIRLNGAKLVFINIDEPYTELGAVALDDRDGEIDVTITGSVDITTAGIYTIRYDATDLSGNSSSIIRTVKVGENDDPVDTTPPK